MSGRIHSGYVTLVLAVMPVLESNPMGVVSTAVVSMGRLGISRP